MSTMYAMYRVWRMCMMGRARVFGDAHAKAVAVFIVRKKFFGSETDMFVNFYVFIGNKKRRGPQIRTQPR